jgi:hypothetical protein
MIVDDPDLLLANPNVVKATTQGVLVPPQPSTGTPGRVATRSDPEMIDNTLTKKFDVQRVIDTYFTCPLCTKLLTNTHVLTGCMHRFCEGCIRSWCRTMNACVCPVCSQSKGQIPMEWGPFRQSVCIPDVMYEKLLIDLILQHQPDASLVDDQTTGEREPSFRTVKNRSGTDDVGLARMPASHMSKRLKSAHIVQRAPKLKSLRPPNVILGVTFQVPPNYIDIQKIRYIAFPLKRTVQEVRQALIRHLFVTGEHNNLHVFVDLDSSKLGQKTRDDMYTILGQDKTRGLINSTATLGDILSTLVASYPSFRPCLMKLRIHASIE